MAWKKTLMNISEWAAGIGATNWGLVEFFDFNLVTAITTNPTLLSVIYALVALGGVSLIWGKLQKYM